jgi:hypothetical protein
MRKTPVLVDLEGPEQKPFAIFKLGAMWLYLAGEEYSFANIANLTWVNSLSSAYHADKLLKLENLKC